MKIAATLSACLGLCVVSGGCSVAPDDSSEMVATTHAALSSSPKGAFPIGVRATYNTATGLASVDVTTTQFQQLPTDPDPHNSDEFLVVMVYIDRPTGRDLVRVLTRDGVNEIGPGGGCIHFSLPAHLGDRLFVGGVVRLAGASRAQVAVAPIVTIAAPG